MFQLLSKTAKRLPSGLNRGSEPYGAFGPKFVVPKSSAGGQLPSNVPAHRCA